MEYYLWLQSVLGYGNGKTLAVLEHFGSASAVYNSDCEALASSGLFTKRELKKAENKDLTKVKATVKECVDSDIKIITPNDALFPQRLLALSDMPLVLYCKGTMPDLNNFPSVCIVGPRKATDFGIKSAYSLSARLSFGGFVTVSGIAVGVDSAVHEGTLFAGGKSVAILPCGHNHSYLAATNKLRENILSLGAVISEYPPSYPVMRGAFQIRNRLLSGMTLGTVVIEAGERSGALITARHANEQGRDVFVVPGNPTEKQYIGSNRLLQDGAKPLLSAKDVFNEYVYAFGDKIDIKYAFSQKIVYNTQSDAKISDDFSVEYDRTENKTCDLSVLSDNAKQVYLSIKNNSFCIDELQIDGFDAADIITIISELELFGFIRAIPGGRFEKTSIL